MQIMQGFQTHGSVIHIHYIERHVHGNGIGIKVYGEMLVQNNQLVYARELKLNTLEELQLTPMGSDAPYVADKYILNKEQYDNYASIHVYKQVDGVLQPVDYRYPGPEPGGSIWLDFEALGE